MNARCCRNILLAIYVVFAVAWSLAVPTFEAPDEPAHWAYVQFMARTWSLPVAREIRTWQAEEGFQGPVYYFLAAVPYRILFGDGSSDAPGRRPEWTETGARPLVLFHHGAEEKFPFTGVAREVHVLRLLSVAIGVAWLACVYWGLRTVFPEPSVLPLVGMGTVAFVPGVMFDSCILSNDGASAAMAALVIACAAWMARHGTGWRGWFGFGLLAGLGVLTKISVFAVVVACVVLLLWWERRDWRRLVGLGTAFGAGFLVVCGWWLLRNEWLCGDLFGIGRLAEFKPWSVWPLGSWTWARVGSSIRFLFISYCGYFGSGSVAMSEWIYRGAAVVTFAWLAAAVWRTMAVWKGWQAPTRRGACLLAAAAAANIAALIKYNVTFAGGEGRYLITSAMAHAATMALGVAAVADWWVRRPLRNARAGCWVAGLSAAVLLVLQWPVLVLAEVLVRRWFAWRPRFLTLEAYLHKAHVLYWTAIGALVAAALMCGLLWVCQRRLARGQGEASLADWWRQRGVGLALGWGAAMTLFNLFCLVKYLLPAYR